MIKIYNRKELKEKYDTKTYNKIINNIINDDEIWDFSINELKYLLLEHNNESFILINDRLYEFKEEL